MSVTFTDVPSFTGGDIISIKQLTAPAVQEILELAAHSRAVVERDGGCDVLKHRILANFFVEPSTRTSCSFQAAMQRLGGSVIVVNESTSSVAKGETLSDSIKALSCYADAIVIRHPVKGSAEVAAIASSKPVLNAGDGTGEHPTQALLDLATILWETQGGAAGAAGAAGGSSGKDVTVTLLGDLKNGRTVHSLARLLALVQGSALLGKVSLQLVAPAELRMPSELVEEVKAAGLHVLEAETLAGGLLSASDVLYVTRVQKERFTSLAEYERLQGCYIVSKALLEAEGAKAGLVVMHPLPRVGEISEDLDSDPRAAYFRQMQNGLYVRMALLALVLGKARELAATAGSRASASSCFTDSAASEKKH